MSTTNGGYNLRKRAYQSVTKDEECAICYETFKPWKKIKKVANICESDHIKYEYKNYEFIASGETKQICHNCFENSIFNGMDFQYYHYNGQVRSRCPLCDNNLDFNDFSKIWKKDKLDKLNEKLYKEYLKYQLCIWCPVPNCGYGIINETPLICRPKNFACPSHGTFCSTCFEQDHPDTNCVDVIKQKRVSNTNEDKFYKWMQREINHNINEDDHILDEGQEIQIPSIKACPQCGIIISKNAGCFHMTCSNCRFEFSWSKENAKEDLINLVITEEERAKILENITRAKNT